MVNSQRLLNQCLESIVQKVQGGVVIHFEKFGADPPIILNNSTALIIDENKIISQPNGIETTIVNLDGNESNDKLESKLSIVNNNSNSQFKHWHTCKKQIYVQRSAQKGYSVGHWPMPESFWPDLKFANITTSYLSPNH